MATPKAKPQPGTPGVQFYHTADDKFVVKGEVDADYIALAADFTADCAALSLPAYPGLPEGMLSRRYRVSKHTLHSEDSQFPGDEAFIPIGDAYLAAYSALCERMEERIAGGTFTL